MRKNIELENEVNGTDGWMDNIRQTMKTLKETRPTHTHARICTQKDTHWLQETIREKLVVTGDG